MGAERRTAGAVREQSLLDEMRAAVRGDRERAAERRAQDTPHGSEAEPEAPEPVEPEVEEEPPKQDGFWGRLTRRSQST